MPQTKSPHADTALQPQERANKQPSTRLQRALLKQWLTAGYLTLFAGLALGMPISLGLTSFPPLLLSVFGLVCLIVLLPLLLAIASAALGRYRLAAAWNALGAALAASGVLAFVYGPLDGYPLLEQVMRSTEGAICSILLALAARSMVSATRALWSAPPQPPRLGPSAQTISPTLTAGTPVGEAADAPAPPWRVQYALT